MEQTFSELTIGGILVAPFVTYAATAAVLLFLLRPLLRLIGFERVFSNPPLAVLGLYVVILATLVVLV